MADELETIQNSLSKALQNFLQQAHERLHAGAFSKPRQCPVTWNCSVLISPIKNEFLEEKQRVGKPCQIQTPKSPGSRRSQQSVKQGALSTNGKEKSKSKVRKKMVPIECKMSANKTDNSSGPPNEVIEPKVIADTECDFAEVSSDKPTAEELEQKARLEHISKLATPKKREVTPPNPLPTPVKPTALEYEPTERLIVLAKPKYKPEYIPIPPSLNVRSSALFYNPTPRILKLAEPGKRFQICNPYEFLQRSNGSALKYRASNRIVELAKPVEREVKYPSFVMLPIQVNQKALTYRATRRIKQLAKPKTVRALVARLSKSGTLSPNPTKKKVWDTLKYIS